MGKIKGKVIRLDEDIYEFLRSRAVPFEDTPSSVLRKILVEAGYLKAEDTPEERTEMPKSKRRDRKHE